ncbi:MAG: dihydrodipicolinate synthase family protein [Candidatus Promineifilaceae bacterium]|nr:dihydrodipicolinate synthase family protein [Candidatus Promineifilaceae bacterium]
MTEKNSMKKILAAIENGVTPAMATPLDDSGYRVDVAAVQPLVEFLLGAGVRGLFVGGTTGEGLLLADNERRRLHEAVLDAVGGRVPTLVHVGANNTRDAVALAEHAATVGASGVVAITPTFLPVSDEALLHYFHDVAEAAPETPFFVYDIPQLAVNGVGPALLARLGESLPTFAGMKCSRTDAQIIRRLIDAAPPGAAVFAGNEPIALGSLAMGATGLITGLSTAVPEPFVALVDAFTAGDIAEARRQQQLINRLLTLLPAGARIGAIKVILEQRGVPVGPAVPPRETPRDLQLWEEMAPLLEGHLQTTP